MGQPEGYIEPSNDGYQYVYQFKDHLGNVRLSYSDKNSDGSITTDEIIEESNYYPFGLQQKGYNTTVNGRSHQYKYNNTELEEGLGLNWYEMPLRSYDPTIARWNRVDPVVHHGLSTYNAFDNNPIVYADPSGADSESPWNRDNRENTLDSGARGSFGFNSIAGSGGIHYNSYTGQYQDRMGRAVSPGEALASRGISIDANSSGMSGLAMLNAALAPYGLYATDPGKKRKVTMMTGDLSDPIFEGGEGWTTEVMGDYSYYGSESSYESDYPEFAGLSLADKNLLWNAKYSSAFGSYANQLEGLLQERERQRRGAHLLHFGKFMAMMWGMGTNYNISLKPLPTKSFNFKGILSDRIFAYRNFGSNELAAFRADGNQFSLKGDFGRKQFWLDHKGLNMWKNSSFAKPHTIQISVPRSHMRFYRYLDGNHALDYGANSLNTLNSSFRIHSLD